MSDTPADVVEKIRQAKSKNLKTLDLSSYKRRDKGKLRQVPVELFDLDQLEELSLSTNLIECIPKSISKLRSLVSLDLSVNNLVSLPESIGELENLTSLDLGYNGLESLPEWICELKNLTSLDLAGNGLKSVPESIGELKNLISLDLGNNLFADIPGSIYQLRSLVKLNLSNYDFIDQKNQIREILPEILKLVNLSDLNVKNNPIENPPAEIVNRGIDAIRNYFSQLESEGKDYLYEAKLLIIGEPGAGKTTLARKIEDSSYELKSSEKSTEGIGVIQWRFPIDDGKQFRVNIWDFGGQEIYHATHQFFLTKRSLYALVADTREENTDFYYWLNAVELLSDNSPLLIIKNEKQDRHREINERQLRGEFSNFKDALATNLATNRGLPQILDEIKHYIRALPHIGAALPKTWVKVRKALEDDPRNYISLEEYLRICEQNGFRQLKDKLQLSGYLHDLGVCLHFQDDPLLKKTVILKTRWGTDAVYKVLDNKQVIANLGKFNRADLEKIWDDPKYDNMQGELLQLMINFKLCYRIPNSEYYIAPQLLTENQPHYDWDETDSLILRYTYEFMPKGIITQFIVAMHRHIKEQKYVWKSGVLLTKDRTDAEVIEYYGKREIKVRVSGRNKKEFLAIVMHEMDEIHDSYKRLKYDRLIPCNCVKCKSDPEPHFYKFETLRKFLGDRQDRIQCQSSYEMVDVRGLIDDVIDRSYDYPERETALSGRQEIGFYGRVEKVIISREARGDAIMKQEKSTPKSAWANGSFFLFVFAIVIAGLGMLVISVPFYALPVILIAGLLFVPIIGALQFRYEDRLSEKSFIELMKIIIGQLPLIGRLANRNDDKDE